MTAAAAVALLLFGLLTAGDQSAVTPSCSYFPNGETFSSNQALGVWYIIPMEVNSPDDANCIEFAKITESERNDLQSKLSGHVPDVKWKNLVLKMQMPCKGEKSWTDPSVLTNRTKDYYLEKLEVDGQYKTLQVPAIGKEEDLSQYGRQEMHLKMVHIKYLYVLDCQGSFAYLLNNKPLREDKELDPLLIMRYMTYW